MLRPLSAILLALMMLLAGCLGGNDNETDDGSGGGSNDGSDDGDDDSDSGGSSNTPNPSATFAASSTSGETPFTVTFTITFSNLGGKTANYEIDVDDDGDPEEERSTNQNGAVTYIYTYQTAGTFNATATAGIGSSVFLDKKIVMTVAQGNVAQNEGPDGPTAPLASCANPLAYETAGTVPGVGEGDPTRVEYAIVNFTENNSWNATFSFGIAFLGAFAFITDEDGAILTAESDTTPGSAGSLVLEGSEAVPAGAAWISLFGCGDPTYTAAYSSTPP